VRIGTKTDLKTANFAVFESPHFVTQSDKAHAELCLLYQSVYQSPCSAFRYSWIHPKVLERLDLLQCTATCSVRWLGFLQRHNTSVLFCVNLHSRLVVRSCKPVKRMLETLFRRCQQHQFDRKKPTVHSAASNSDASSTQLDCLSNSYKLNHEEERRQHTPSLESNIRGERLWLNSTDRSETPE